MQSLTSKIVLGLLVHRHLFKFRLRQKPFDPSMEGILQLRKETEDAGLKFGRLTKEARIEPMKIGNMYAEWVRMPGSASGKAILYFHGGMYLIGSAQSHRVHVVKFVKSSGLDALVFNYRLAPECPFPQALNDAITAYSYLLSNTFEPENIVFAGDSAGAGLCLATLLAIKDRELPLPKAAAVLSPWTDLTLSGNSYRRNSKSCLSPIGSAEAGSNLYSGMNDRMDPLISPLFGNLAGLPPLHISAGTNEILLDDAVRFAEKAKAAGVDVKLLIGEGLCHCYPAFGNLFKEAADAMKEIGLFLRKHANS